jgi:transglutaminase-like putative cysteine protease
MKNFYFLLIAILFGANCIAQSTPDYKILKAKYPIEGAVYLNITQELNIEYENKALKITSSNSQERILLDNRAGLFSQSSIDYGDFSKLISIEASTQLSEKGNFKEIKVKDFKTTDRLSTSSVFYDGSKNVSFFYPSLAEGAKTKLTYVQEISQPQLIPGFYFEHHLPVLKAVYTVSAPSDVELGWKIFNMADSLISFSKVAKKNKTIYTWEVQNVRSYRDEEFAPNYLYSMGHMVAWINSYTVNGKKTPLLGTTKNLYDWYYNLSKNCNADNSDDMKNVVDSLTKNAPTELEKVRRIYYWVQDHIKYIAFENGMEGFVPRSGKLVFERRYGDCKDMASILTKMMSYAGIPSYLTWIGSRHIPYKYEDVPSPQVDNHMIATYIKGHKYYFLDATANNLPLGVSNSFIQGKEALIGIDKDKLEVKEVPVMPMQDNLKVDSVLVELDGNKISGNGHASFKGYNKMYLEHSLKDHRNEKSKMLKAELNKGSNKFQLNSFDVANLDDRDKNLSVKYEFVLEDYLKTIGDELYLNVNLNRNYFIEEIKSNRTFDIEKDYKETRINIIKVKIPKGYSVSEIPAPASFKDERFGFESKYKVDKDFLILEQNIYYNFLYLKKDEFADWNKYFKSLKKSYSDLIVFKKLAAASAK